MNMSSSPCHFGFVYETRYDVFTILSASITLFQLLLFVHTIYHEYSQRNCTVFEQSKTMRILYIILQMLAISAVLCDHFRYTIDSHTGVLRHNFGCRLVAYAPWYISGLYWGTYFGLLCYRLQSSFHDSFLALSRWTLYTLRALVLLPPIMVTTSMAMSRPDLECIETWHPPDLSYPIEFCELQFDMLIPMKYHIFPGLIVLNTVLSITFCAIFCVKLKQFLRTQQGVTSPHRMDRCAGIEFETVIVKMSILTVTGALSTIIAYVFRFNIYDYGHIFLLSQRFAVYCLMIDPVIHRHFIPLIICVAVAIRSPLIFLWGRQLRMYCARENGLYILSNNQTFGERHFVTVWPKFNAEIRLFIV